MRNTANSNIDQPAPPIIGVGEAGAVARAASLLAAGKLVAFPTETVYGLGADASSDCAVDAIFSAKGRPAFNPLIVHVANLADAEKYGLFDATALALAAAFWPGGVTLVVPKRKEASLAKAVTAGLGTVALRVPGHRVARELITQAGVPVAAPSANRSGAVSPTLACHVAKSFGPQLAMVLDDGATRCGLESTIIASPEPGGAPTLLRPGAVARAAIEAVLGCQLASHTGKKITAPGQLARHYAPRARLRLNARALHPGEVMVAFGPPPPGVAQSAIVYNLSPGGDLAEAGANLYVALRALDACGVPRAAIMPVPATGLGEAINDRLTRAATLPEPQ
ncbi:MAG: L-threonylcarbamoyladenylate synthase [Alphaproteobacteria bacterium]